MSTQSRGNDSCCTLSLEEDSHASLREGMLGQKPHPETWDACGISLLISTVPRFGVSHVFISYANNRRKGKIRRLRMLNRYMHY